jgi:tripartite-type tricarboxylate transporter receptor subunit TctC
MTLRLRLLIAALLVVALPAQAQTWPEKGVRIVVPFPPGGSNDALCRIVADKLSPVWKLWVIVDNTRGAGGNIGA